MSVYDWYDHPLDVRAVKGGEVGANGQFYKAGEFLPFYIPRDEMPQIDEKDYVVFFGFLKERNVQMEIKTFHPKELHAHQRVNWSKVHAMDQTVMDKPILVSKDGYVLDGNHRWWAHVLQKTDLKAYQIDLEFEEAIKLLFDFPKTYAYGDGNFHPISH